ncbi:hypothetical protein [Ruegeria sp. HKCCA5839]|uniref:hypothetical protein n=1 Tax=Ruegeria sp. HKCCA5839 TaxID=2682981 RepID=UPI001C2B7C77|nr:hypothetical protein [Ruegeria sp. HKCCA5839]
MFYLDFIDEDVECFRAISTSASWEPWLKRTIPSDWDATVKRRLVSNLKHTLAGLEMKAGLIVPQEVARCAGRHSVLFEPYFQVLTFEFCVGTFSVCEGIGSSLYLSTTGGDAERRVYVSDWKSALVQHFDAKGRACLDENVGRVKAIRDKMHQDKLGARENIDWHEFGYEGAFVPAKRVLECLLRTNGDRVPSTSNLG